MLTTDLINYTSDRLRGQVENYMASPSAAY